MESSTKEPHPNSDSPSDLDLCVHCCVHVGGSDSGHLCTAHCAPSVNAPRNPRSSRPDTPTSNRRTSPGCETSLRTAMSIALTPRRTSIPTPGMITPWSGRPILLNGQRRLSRKSASISFRSTRTRKPILSAASFGSISRCGCFTGFGGGGPADPPAVRERQRPLQGR